MHTVDLLEQAIAAARRLGWQVREDWLDGNGGGACYIKGQKWIFLDLAQDARDHLAVVCEALAREVGIEDHASPSQRAAPASGTPCASKMLSSQPSWRENTAVHGAPVRHDEPSRHRDTACHGEMVGRRPAMPAPLHLFGGAPPSAASPTTASSCQPRAYSAQASAERGTVAARAPDASESLNLPTLPADWSLELRALVLARRAA
ncbi:MAG: hypothetical protein K6T86_04855 [Pirellulales bacterium]|nr:hypothetical protein [Pirellulales bacterium]